MSPTSPQGISGEKLIAVMAACILLFAAVGVFVFHSGQEESAFSRTGFDLSRVEQRQAVAARATTPLLPSSSPAPMKGSDILTAGSDLPSGPSAGRTSKTTAPDWKKEDEKKFLAQHAAELTAYRARLQRITDRYYKESPVVRDVDRAFGQMSRYMAIKRRYEQDRDPFQFTRDAVALPEVRAEIRRRLADPEVWKASLGMISDALKDPPPPAVYKGVQGFVLKDPSVSAYIGGELAQDVTKNLNAATITAAIGPETDLAPITKMVQDMDPRAR